MIPKPVYQQQAEHDDKLATILAAMILTNLGFSYRTIGRLLGVSHEWVRQQMRHPSTVDDKELNG